MAGNELYTVKDLANHLEVGESTVRFWRDRYNEFISSVGKGKSRKYCRETLEVLRFIQEKSNRSESQEQIKEQLSHQFPLNIEPEKSQRSTAAAQQYRSEEQEQALATKFAGELLEQVKGILQEQNRRMETLEAENKELRERLVQLETQNQNSNSDLGTAIPQQKTAAGYSREQVIQYLQQLYFEGYSFRAMAAKLNSEGVPGLKGGTWHRKTISRIIKRESNT